MDKHFYFFALLIFVFPALSHAQSSADAFNRFVASSPETRAEVEKVAKAEQIDAGCMYSGQETHIGVSITKEGDIYNWTMGDNDRKEQRKLIKNDKNIANALFALKDANGFANASLDYEIDGTSYCYVRTRSGASAKQIIWPRNGLMSGGKTIPPAAKELFDRTISSAASAMSVQSPKK